MILPNTQFYLPSQGTLIITPRNEEPSLELSFSPYQLESAGTEEELFNLMRESLCEAVALISPLGTPFQQAVWRAVAEIPFGETVTYSDIASRIGRPKAFRAVGTAVGANPIALMIPCHRVLPASGGIGGYYFGKAVKEVLLTWENAFAHKHPELVG